MKFHRQQYIDLLTHKNADRQMFVELFGPLIGLEDEWRSQGATEDEVNLIGFDFDYVDRLDCGGNTGILGGVEPHVVKETDEYIISVDEYGRTMKLMRGFATSALPLDYPVFDMDSWLKLKHWFQYSDKRIDWEQVEKAKKMQQRGSLVLANIPGGFDLLRELMGAENACICYYEDPELVKDIMDTVTNTAFRVLDKISDHVTIDNLSVHEDMAGKSGPLIGPNLIEKYIKPYYKCIWDMLSQKGTKLFSQDSDGNMNPVIDVFMDSGVNIIYPAEPRAGMDIVMLRKKYGQSLSFKGGIDKYVLLMDKKAIRDELEYKLQTLMQKGGNIFGIDHRIPNGTLIDNYRYYVDTAREILGIPPRGDAKGWRRMAF